MDLTTRYLGLRLKNPVMVGASTLSSDASAARALEDAGASAIVLESLFEEQILQDSHEIDHFLTYGAESFAEATSYFPMMDDYRKGPDDYLEHIRRVKEAVSVPVFGSLNGVSKGGWIQYAKKMEQAGVDGLELNIYYIPTDPDMPGSEVEKAYVESLAAVKEAVKVPVAIKLGPYFSNMANVARQLDGAGADGLVLFNRFYQPDIDLESLEVKPNLVLSTSFANRLTLRWVALLYGHVKADLAATNGVHTHEDVIKLLMAGASVTQMGAALYKNGVPHLGKVVAEVKRWMEEHEYESVEQMRGSISQKNCAQPAAFERANYIKTLTTYR